MEGVFNVFHDFIDFMLAQLKKMSGENLCDLFVLFPTFQLLQGSTLLWLSFKDNG